MIYLVKAIEFSMTTTLIGCPIGVTNKCIGGHDRCNKKKYHTPIGGKYITDRSPIVNKKIGYPIDIKN